MASLDQWLAWAPQLEQIYQEELGRSAFSDPEAFVNWTYHWRESGSTAADIRTAIQQSPEWQQRHGSGSPTFPDGPSVPPVPPAPPSEPPMPPVDLPFTDALRVTNASDGELVHRMYSYWANAYLTPDDAVIVFVGHADGRPRFFRVTRAGVERLGPVLGYGGTAEGWYWDREGWIYLTDGPRLRRVHPFTGDDVVVLDVSGPIAPDTVLWQAHSSDDGRVHSATVKRIVAEGAYPAVGTVIVRDGDMRLFPPVLGTLDESQIDPSGTYCVIKEGDDNRVISVPDWTERALADADGALGHSDCGAGFAVGENNQIGACVYLDLATLQQRSLFSTWNMGHIAVRGSRCLLSNQEHLALVALDGSGVTPVHAHGMQGDGYDFQVKANLDPTGRVACYMSNAAGRMDVYLLAL